MTMMTIEGRRDVGEMYSKDVIKVVKLGDKVNYWKIQVKQLAPTSAGKPLLLSTCQSQEESKVTLTSGNNKRPDRGSAFPYE